MNHLLPVSYSAFMVAPGIVRAVFEDTAVPGVYHCLEVQLSTGETRWIARNSRDDLTNHWLGLGGRRIDPPVQEIADTAARNIFTLRDLPRGKPYYVVGAIVESGLAAKRRTYLVTAETEEEAKTVARTFEGRLSRGYTGEGVINVQILQERPVRSFQRGDTQFFLGYPPLRT